MTDLPTLCAAWKRCREADYISVENKASYALQSDGDRLFILFEQSNGLTDWKNNLDFPVRPYKRMDGEVWLCHRGFLRVWKSVEPYLEKSVADRRYRQITVIGYSHGAALATLAHEYVWFHRPDLRQNGLVGYGFGAPRVFFGSCRCLAYRQRWRTFSVVRNGNDLVTHLPPAFLGYRHVNAPISVGTPSGSAIADHTPEAYDKTLCYCRSFECREQKQTFS